MNEAYLKLVANSGSSFENRAHFFGVAARVMRQILVDHARTANAGKRGGGEKPLPLNETIVFGAEQSAQTLVLDEALQRLEKLNPRQSRIVELRYFGGLSIAEISEVLSTSKRTIDRDWAVALAWLRREIET